MENGSLQDRLQLINCSPPISWESRISIVMGIARALVFLHSKAILHGNIKSTNVLLGSCFSPKLCDFGARILPSDTRSGYTNTQTDLLETCLTYFPDDFISNRQISEKVDVFSCGVVFAEILTGLKARDKSRKPSLLHELIREETDQVNVENPRLAAEEICRKYLDKKAGKWPLCTAVEFARVVCLCFQKRRPTASEVHTLLEKLDIAIKYPAPLHNEEVNVLHFENGPSSMMFNSQASTALANGMQSLAILKLPCESDDLESLAPVPAMQVNTACCSTDTGHVENNPSGFLKGSEGCVKGTLDLVKTSGYLTEELVASSMSSGSASQGCSRTQLQIPDHLDPACTSRQAAQEQTLSPGFRHYEAFGYLCKVNMAGSMIGNEESSPTETPHADSSQDMSGATKQERSLVASLDMQVAAEGTQQE
ncbi:interleukin-1 receptor-associated kinase 1-like [Polyodon spathula]|uniref:interleukin-1 receptor-associated kinase 1-like n=1 Tax=Polyodon spathula TaxID=7913 RepID=UPI001B7F3B23|nr:interleukin-1 receptor-associated kinase 1-like [Polyodon spathula]